MFPPRDFKSLASTNFATRACSRYCTALPRNRKSKSKKSKLNGYQQIHSSCFQKCLKKSCIGLFVFAIVPRLTWTTTNGQKYHLRVAIDLFIRARLKERQAGALSLIRHGLPDRLNVHSLSSRRYHVPLTALVPIVSQSFERLFQIFLPSLQLNAIRSHFFTGRCLRLAIRWCLAVKHSDGGFH